MLLSNPEKQQLDAVVARAERSTGAQIVAAIVPRSDSYPERLWMAFACGASLGMLAVVALNIYLPPWEPIVIYWVATILGAGAASAVACVFAPSLARLLLAQVRMEVETQQMASKLFVDREVFATNKRIGVLLLTSVFERQIVVLPDKGLRERVSADSWQRVVESMREPLRQGRYALAIEVGVTTIESILIENAFCGDATASNELPDAVIEASSVRP